MHVRCAGWIGNAAPCYWWSTCRWAIYKEPIHLPSSTPSPSIPHFPSPSLPFTLTSPHPHFPLPLTLTSPHPHFPSPSLLSTPHFPSPSSSLSSLPLTSPHSHSLHLHCTYALVAGQWASLGGQEQKEKERFLAGEQRASRGFMTQVSSIECHLKFTRWRLLSPLSYSPI